MRLRSPRETQARYRLRFSGRQAMRRGLLRRLRLGQK